MAILGKAVATTSDTHVYTVPASRRAVLLISATNTNSDDIQATLSVRQNVDYEVGSVLIEDEGTAYTEKPTLEFSEGNVEAEVSQLNVKDFDLTGAETGYNIGDILTATDATNKDSEDVNFSITVTSIDAGTGMIVSYVFNENGTYAEAIPGTDTITFSGGTGVGATVNLSTLTYGIKEITVTTPGDDYTSVPDVTALDGGVELSVGGATLTAQMISDAIRRYDAIEYETVIPFGSALERSAIVLGEGDSIYARSSVDDVLNVMVFGVEEIA